MKHLSFEIICRIADSDIHAGDIEEFIVHLRSCKSCQQEVELQRSIVKVSQQSQLIQPSSQFTKNVLEDLVPSKKRWYEWILHNMGNIIAMASVLSFMGYIFSVTGNSPFQEETPSKVTPIMQFFKIFQDGSKQLGSYLVQKSHLQGLETSHTNTIAFAFLAILLLVFIDKIAGHFFYRSKI